MDHFNFKFLPTGLGVEDAIVTFDLDLLQDTFHTFAIFDQPPTVQVMRLVDDPDGIFPGQIRLRWTHAALGLGPLDVRQVNGDILHADDLDFGATTVDDFDSGVMTIGIDNTGDGVPEWVFTDFNLDPNSMVDLWIVNDCPGCTPFLIAHQPNGNTPRRDVIGPDTDTGP